MDGRLAPRLPRIMAQPARRVRRRRRAGGRPEMTAGPKTLQEWLSEGEQLYDAALGDYRNLESQLEELEQRLAAKLDEVNQIAQMMGKPPVEASRRLTAEIIETPERGAAAATLANVPQGH